MAEVKRGKEWAPSAKQVEAMTMLLDIGTPRTKTEICECLGLSSKTFWGWLKDDKFLNYMQEQISILVKGEVGDVWRALIKKAQAGDVQAIKLFFEMIGEYKDRKELTGSNGQAIVFKWVDEDDYSNTV